MQGYPEARIVEKEMDDAFTSELVVNFVQWHKLTTLTIMGCNALCCIAETLAGGLGHDLSFIVPRDTILQKVEELFDCYLDSGGAPLP